MAVAFHRGVVALKLREVRSGAMLAVGLSEEEAKPLIESISQGCVKVACVNSTSNVTISGDREAVLELSKVSENPFTIFNLVIASLLQSRMAVFVTLSGHQLKKSTWSRIMFPTRLLLHYQLFTLPPIWLSSELRDSARGRPF